ncbi:MAG: ATP-grasp domain-containing protein [Polyangiaceae bacterium]|nr:ATP-grasp domain-containing protein [Polyangiaceae bacterium]
MFRKVLVANRGEIAVRILRTLREMGIASVAVYSDADRRALHVRLADEAVGIGPARASESYLRPERILDAARATGAEAICPGYGFLSENTEFAGACHDAGIVFVGPPASAIAAMGSKPASRALMDAAKVPIVPGGRAGSLAEALVEAERIGYPVMLKAAFGGGGKGMRLCHARVELERAFDRASSEAAAAFGDGTVYLERAIVRPRHVEVQLLGDQHGSVVHLHERDCSVQRRHQKIVEETPCPAPAATPELMAEMGAVAVQAARAVGYYSAGTVEFLMDEAGRFYFLEMNTRLQVEHPITEWVTGLDLVAEMLRVAAGERLAFGQEDVVARGASIECRIYAEDPAAGFLPSPGVVRALRVPSGPFVRDDGGYDEGAEVSGHYDPLVSKLSVWGPTRAAALGRMRRALGEYRLSGVRNNLAFLELLLSHPEFAAGRYHTGFIADHKDALLGERALPDGEAEAVAVAVALAAARATTPEPAVTAGGRGPSTWVQGHRARLGR